MKKIVFASIIAVAVIFFPTRASSEWDWTDTDLFRSALKLMERETRAQESIAKSLEAIAKSCNKN